MPISLDFNWPVIVWVERETTVYKKGGRHCHPARQEEEVYTGVSTVLAFNRRLNAKCDSKDTSSGGPLLDISTTGGWIHTKKDSGGILFFWLTGIGKSVILSFRTFSSPQ